MHAALLAAQESHEAAEGLPPELVGVGAFGALVLLLVVTWAFRNAHNRH